jgi:hypothetical protein
LGLIRGTLRVVVEDVDVRAGMLVSVDHGEERRFVDVVEDLETLVRATGPAGRGVTGIGPATGTRPMTG